MGWKVTDGPLLEALENVRYGWMQENFKDETCVMLSIDEMVCNESIECEKVSICPTFVTRL